jgi:hypothetical protein
MLSKENLSLAYLEERRSYIAVLGIGLTVQQGLVGKTSGRTKKLRIFNFNTRISCGNGSNTAIGHINSGKMRSLF